MFSLRYLSIFDLKRILLSFFSSVQRNWPVIKTKQDKWEADKAKIGQEIKDNPLFPVNSKIKSRLSDDDNILCIYS